MTTNEMIAKLKNMAQKAGEALYERAKLAAKVLADDEWIDAEFGGDYDKAFESLESDCFPELTAWGVGRLLAVVDTFPDVADWRRCKFNVMRLWAEHEEKKQKERGDKIPAVRAKGYTFKEREEIDTKVHQLEWDKKQLTETTKRIESEVDKLRRENDELRGEIKALNRMLEQLRQGRVSV